jgi:FkbM family methyltransferase
MLKKLRAEYHFRQGRRRRDVSHLHRAVRLDKHNARPAIELGKLGVAEPICASLLLNLSGLREYAIKEEFHQDCQDLLALIISHLGESRGQLFQDVATLWATNGKRDGYFVEVGTGNGEQLSNTYMLEQQFGWSGILFEPDRRFHTNITDKRKAILDKRAVYCEEMQNQPFLEVNDAGQLSTLAGHSRDDGRTRTGQHSMVDTVTLTTALREHGAPNVIDFVSIDTEGSEMEVLKGIDFEQFDIRFLAIEHNFIEGRKNQLNEFLSPHGYREIFPEFSHHDIWLTKDSADCR